MELLLLFPELQSKKFCYKMCLTLTNESKTGFPTSSSRLHLDCIQSSSTLQLLAKPELGTTPVPACFKYFTIIVEIFFYTIHSQCVSILNQTPLTPLSSDSSVSMLAQTTHPPKHADVILEHSLIVAHNFCLLLKVLIEFCLSKKIFAFLFLQCSLP